MEGADLLQTIAEVSVAFAGFAAIVIAVRHRGARGLAPEEAIHLQLMLGPSLATVAFSLIPLWLFHIGVSPDGIWGISSGGMALYLSIVTPLDARRGSRMMRKGLLERTPAAVVAVLGVTALVSQAANATGLIWGRTFGGLLAGLLLLLALSGFTFFRLVAVPSRGSSDAAA